MMFGRLRKRPEPPPLVDPIDGIETPDVWIDFRSRLEWLTWRAAHFNESSSVEAEAIAASVKTIGAQSGFFGRIPASAVKSPSGNHREDLTAAGFNPRLRVVLERLIQLPAAGDFRNFRIYGHEALTPFALLLRGRYPLYLGSEYATEKADIQRLYPIPAIDITCSGLPDEIFDVVVSNEVLEHVPDLDAALRDTVRILKPGGRLIATFPFAAGRDETLVRAVAEEGGVRFLSPPEYHGNPADPERGSLVFQIPAWDILGRATAAGFRDSWITYASSRRKGFTDSKLAGIFLFEAKK